MQPDLVRSHQSVAIVETAFTSLPIAKKKAGQAPNESQVSKPTTWNEALKRMLRQARRQVARTENAILQTNLERTSRAE